LRAFWNRVAREDELVLGETYVWLEPGPEPRRLATGEIVSTETWVEPAYLPGEAMAQAIHYAVVSEPGGRVRTVPRSVVLWPAADHAAVRASASALGLPVVPSSLRGGASWRLGGVRLEVADMVELGRLVLVA
jgi:hypothetical protein